MPISERYDFVLLFDVQDGNPNGDPDAGNLPRIDPETGRGLVTDVCLKRKIRDYVAISKAGTAGYGLFIQRTGIPLNDLIDDAAQTAGIDLTKEESAEGKKRERHKDRTNLYRMTTEESPKARDEMCKRYYDIRAFGAVMNTGANAGQVRGPVQLTFSRSIDPIVTLEHSITRVAVTKASDVEKEREMGRKNTVPYALYRAHGFVSPAFASQTGFSQADLDLLWQALQNMFELDRSAARGLMTSRALLVFKHESPLGNARAADLFERVRARRRSEEAPPRSYADYEITVNEVGLPAGVEIQRLL